MRKHFLLIVCVLFSLVSLAQPMDVSQLSGYKPRSIGPAGMSGRVTSIDVELENPSHIVIGTASGGIWESWNEGISWKPIFDKAPVQSVGAIAMNQRSPEVIWAGTGEGNPRNSHNSGIGIFKTLDGGETWKCMGLENSRNIHRIIIHPDDPNTVYVGVLGSAWGDSEERGVFKTTDGGVSWKKVLYMNDSTGCADLILDPRNPNKLIAAMWQFRRQPWHFTSGGKSSGLYVSFDGGETWKQRSEKDGLPKGELGRIGLAQVKSKPHIIYALIESKKTGLYKSTDGGFKWKLVSTENIGNRPFYYADIYADPLNENRLYNLYSVISKSEDGGKSFEVIAPYSKIHPDHHALWIHPENPEFIINGNDGGLNISKDGGRSWRYINNLPLGQFYHINVDNDIPYNIYGGLQDNGSWVGPGYVYENQGIRNYHWREVAFGDGFDVVPQKDNNRYGFAMWQGGNLQHYDRQTGRTSYVQPRHEEGVELRFNWNAAIAQDPFVDSGIYFGSQHVHYSANAGKSWRTISPDLTTNDTSKQKQATSGGLTIDATKAENYTTILAIAPSPLDSNVIWASTDDGNLQITKDKGASWTNLSSKLPGAPSGAWIPQIEVSRHMAGEAYVVVNDYRRNDWRPYLYKTINYGQSWTRILDENKAKGHVWSVVQDLEERNLLFAGTEHGLYVTFDGGENWSKWTEGLPSVPVSDLKIQEREHDLIIGTFGRAVYVLDDIRPLRAIVKDEQLLKKNMVAFPAPDVYPHPWRQPRGIRFAGDADFRGQNKGRGAMFTLWINPELLKGEDTKEGSDKEKAEAKKPNKGKKSKDKKVKVVVYNSAGDSIRQYTFKADTGIVRRYWNLRENGVRYPQRKELSKKQKEADPNPGTVVMPGRYKMVFTFKGNKDSTWVNVKQHPKYSFPIEDILARYELSKTFEKDVKLTFDAVERLKEMKKVVKDINAQTSYLNDSIADTLKKSGKVITDSANALLDLFFLKEGFKGYDHVSENMSSRLGRVGNYLRSENVLENEGLKRSREQLMNELNPILVRINKLSNDQWKSYQLLVESSKFEYFKDLQPLGQE